MKSIQNIAKKHSLGTPQTREPHIPCRTKTSVHTQFTFHKKLNRQETKCGHERPVLSDEIECRRCRRRVCGDDELTIIILNMLPGSSRRDRGKLEGGVVVTVVGDGVLLLAVVVVVS